MTAFSDLPSGSKTLFLTVLLLLNLYQFGYLYLLYVNRRYGLFIVNLIPAAAVFASMPVLGSALYFEGTAIAGLPAAAAWTFAALIFAYTTVFLVSELRRARNTLSSGSVKEAFDTLPAGICIFSENGLPVLCNTQMYRLVYQLSGKDLQTLYEVEAALEKPAPGVELLDIKDKKGYRVPDRSVWSFEKSEIIAGTDERYIMVRAADLTELYGLGEELTERNRELKSMIGQVQRVAANVAEITRQQEILSAKMRVHNKMGNCLLSARRYAAQGYHEDMKEQVISLWRESLGALRDEIAAEDEPDACEEVIRIAKSIGVDVRINGKMPGDSRASYIIVVAIRECVTNALRHAGATELYVDITEAGGTVEALFTNNGKRPENDIIPGGGLTSLAERVEKAGGSFFVQSRPVFALTVRLPARIEKEI